MVNWASTSYRIEGSRSDLERLFDVIDGFMRGKVQPIEEGADATWEGNIVKALGATDRQINENYLRGFIAEYELDDGSIRIEVEEAWGASDFRHLLTKLMPELTVYFVVEEPGCEVYATNDVEGKYFPYRFSIDACLKNCDFTDFFDTKEEAMKCVAEILGKEDVTEEDIDKFNEEHFEGGDYYIRLCEYSVVDC